LWLNQIGISQVLDPQFSAVVCTSSCRSTGWESRALVLCLGLMLTHLHHTASLQESRASLAPSQAHIPTVQPRPFVVKHCAGGQSAPDSAEDECILITRNADGSTPKNGHRRYPSRISHTPSATQRRSATRPLAKALPSPRPSPRTAEEALAMRDACDVRKRERERRAQEDSLMYNSRNLLRESRED
jgi:hypothetical protein